MRWNEGGIKINIAYILCYIILVPYKEKQTLIFLRCILSIKKYAEKEHFCLEILMGLVKSIMLHTWVVSYCLCG